MSFQGRNTHREDLWMSFIQGEECCCQGVEMDWFILCPAAGIAGKAAVDWNDKMSSCSGATQFSGLKQVERAKFSFVTCCKRRELWNEAKRRVIPIAKFQFPQAFMGISVHKVPPSGRGTGGVTGGDLVSWGPKCF